MAANAQEIAMGEVRFAGIPALFSELRLDRSTIPKSLHVYEMRRAANDPFRPVQIAQSVDTYFYGTLITVRPLRIPTEGIFLKEHPFNFSKANVMDLNYFMQLNHVKDKPQKAHER